LKTRKALLGWLVCASAALSGGIAVASAILGDVITGPITAINVNTVTILGQVVDVQLNGSAKSSASQVINITLHAGG